MKPSIDNILRGVIIYVTFFVLSLDKVLSKVKSFFDSLGNDFVQSALYALLPTALILLLLYQMRKVQSKQHESTISRLKDLADILIPKYRGASTRFSDEELRAIHAWKKKLDEE